MSIKKDVAEYAYAKMNYGEGAGIMRKKVMTKIADKMKDANYAAKFNEELEKINLSDFTGKVEFDHAVKATADTVKSGVKSVKRILAALGITTTAAIVFYLNNRELCNYYLKKFYNKTRSGFINLRMDIRAKCSDIQYWFRDKFKKKPKKLIDFKDRIDPNSFNRT